MKTPTLAETYRVLCGALRAKPGLAVAVANHIAAKHGIHSLPAFHTSDAVPDPDKLATYGELARALHTGDLSSLQGQAAGGQAKSAPPAREEERPAPHPLPRRDSVLPEIPRASREPAPVAVVPFTPPAPRAADPFGDRLRELLIEVIGELPAALDESKVRALAQTEDATLRAELAKLVAEANASVLTEARQIAERIARDQAPQRHEFKLGADVRPVAGAIHRQIPQVVAWLNADVPVWLWGQAGGGKTHLARQAAEALGLPFYCAPIDETITVGKLVGFRNVATGEFVEGLLYRAYKHGGVQLLDEIDTNATAIASINSLAANAHYTFPSGEEVPRHKDFRLLAGANTKGTGATAGYTARVRMDAATLDRFAVLKLDYDPGLELALTCGVPSASAPWQSGPPAEAALCRAFVDWIQKVRAAVGNEVLVSPRASYLGVKALRAGIPPAEVAEALVFKLVTADTRARMVAAAGEVPAS